MATPSLTDFLVVPINGTDLVAFYRGSNISRPLYIRYDTLVSILSKAISPSTSGLLLQTNGTNNPVQTLLNLVQGSGITITDDGAGNITFTATGGGSVTADNGLTETAGNVQLGGTLLFDTTIDTDTFTLLLTGTHASGGIIIDVRNTGTGGAAYFQSEQSAITAYSTLKPAVDLLSEATATILARNRTNGATVEISARLCRLIASGAVSNGTGIAVDLELPRSSSPTSVTTSRFVTLWSNISAFDSEFELWTMSGNVLTRKLLVYKTGQLKLDLYGTGAFSGTVAYSLGVDASGNVIEFTGGGGGTVTGVTATLPITSSGGTAPVISTSMATNKLIGRGTAGTGIMEEITLGTNLSLSGTTLNASGGGESISPFLLMGG